MEVLRSQLAEVLDDSTGEKAGLLQLDATSDNADTDMADDHAELFQAPMRVMRGLERALRRVAGISGRRAEQLLEGDERGLPDLAGILREAAGDFDVTGLATLRTVIIVDQQVIFRGSLDVMCSRLAVTRFDTPVLYMALRSVMLGLPDGHSLIRDHAAWGYHYHYSDDGNRRSDILLTFSRDPAVSKKPVTWEPHAVKKAKFKARVPTWGEKKCVSVHEVCLRDLSKRKLTDYVMPSKEARLLLS
jgi:hypothetical protein